MEIKRLVVGEIEANCYILSSAGELCVIDPGADGEYIVAETKKNGGALKYIINTHYHPDHIDANTIVQKNCGGEILIHEKEKDYIDFQPDRFLRESDKISFGNENLVVLHTPGHSEGSICLLHQTCIFTGDTVFLNGCGRVDLLGGSTKDLEQSLERLAEIIKPGMVVYPGHGDLFQEEKNLL